MTALPIFDTQSGEASVYFPINVISITDRQVILSFDQFNAGPYINVGISVSRLRSAAHSASHLTVTNFWACLT